MNRYYTLNASPTGVTRIARTVIDGLWVEAVREQILAETIEATYARLVAEFSAR